MIAFPRIAITTLHGAWLALIIGCGGGEEVTDRSVAQARRIWERAAVTDYDLEWVSTSPSRSRYAVEVRGGQVRSVSSITPDGRRFPLKPAEPRFYGVDGLFLVIADELAQLQTEAPFGRPKGTRAVLRFTPDPTYGYPRSYRRDVVGAPASLAIDVVTFAPRSAGEKMLIPGNMPDVPPPHVVD
ncbi:MAG: DUF6174 domain-containing protein [Isosphaeraceae bacterium]